MEPFEDRELSDIELQALLKEWKAPQAPKHLRASIFPHPGRPIWRRLLTASIPVPVPIACGLLIFAAFGAWRWSEPAPERVVIKTERVEVPVIRREIVTHTVYRERRAPAPPPAIDTDPHALQPVSELRARVIRSGNEQN